MIDNDKGMRWMANNFLETGVSSLVVSSENPDFKKGNLTSKDRNKAFKFNGRFLIEEDVNDKLYIDAETYTIPSGEYKSFDELLGVTIVGTKTVTIVRDEVTNTLGLDCGETPVTLELSNRTESAWDTIGFTNTLDLVTTSEITYANESRVHWPYDYIEMDLGFQAPIGFIGIISSIANEVTIPAGATVKLLANNVSSFDTPPLEVTIPWFKTGMFRFIDDVEDSVWRYVRLVIECPNSSIIPEIGYLYIGDYEKGGSRNISTGFEMYETDLTTLSSSDYGVVYSNPRPSYRVFSSLSLGLVRPDQVAFIKSIWKRKKKDMPFFIALDPKGYLSDSLDEYIMFANFVDSPRFSHVLRNIFNSSFELREVV